jgi:hypothetical protein
MRALTIVSALALTLSALAACSAQPDGSPPRTGGTSGDTSSGLAGGQTSSFGGSPSGSSGAPGTSFGGSPPLTGTAGAQSSGFAGAPPAGTAGATGGAGAGAVAGAACGMGRAMPMGPTIENFAGMTQVLEWDQADMLHPTGMNKIMPMGMLTVMASNNGTNGTYAAGLLAKWAATARPCMDGSTYTGIQFTVTGNTTDLLFRVATPGTTPATDGGICADTLCAYAHFQANMTASLAAGGTAKVAFSSLMQPWANSSVFDKSALTEIVFLTTDITAGHSFTISNISFY